MVTRIIETSETFMMGAMTRKYIATAIATTAMTDRMPASQNGSPRSFSSE